jgi:hypothetical protein
MAARTLSNRQALDAQADTGTAARRHSRHAKLAGLLLSLAGAAILR